jgi:hypothetical protein
MIAFMNSHYQGNNNSFFLPPLGQLLRGVSLWSDFFLRWSSVLSLAKLPDELHEYVSPSPLFQ